ncbi:MAG TPA: MFS transporter [Stellaceae bacterium]|nr:MFS transporter [Stellaceae bacterium]
MAGVETTSNWLGFYDNAKLTPRYFLTIFLLVCQGMFEFYDFFIVGYLVAVLAPSWHLTYGQSSIMLLSGGLGAVVGGLSFGLWADRFGRRNLVALSGLIFSLGCGACATLPQGAWILFSLCRFVVGFGMAGAVGVQNTMVVEITPTRFRTYLSSLMLAPAALGTFFAAIIAAHLMPLIGWRGVAATGALPILISGAIMLWVPESARWLMTRNRFADARKAAARQLGVPESGIAMPADRPVPVAPVPLSELLHDQKRFWWVSAIWFGCSAATYGVQLWGPTIVSQLLKIPAATAASYFIWLAVLNFAGRVSFSFLPVWIGRRASGMLMTYVSAVLLVLGGLYNASYVGGMSVFVLVIVGGAFFYSGGFANLTPYTVEVYPVRLGARAIGLGQAMNGVGKIVGPLMLALIAGSGDIVSPKATAAAVEPAFMALAGCLVIAALAFTLFRVETHGKQITQISKIEDEPERAEPQRRAVNN